MKKWIILLFLILSSCATSDKGFDHKKVSNIEEFSQVVKIETMEPEVVKEPLKETKKIESSRTQKETATKKNTEVKKNNEKLNKVLLESDKSSSAVKLSKEVISVGDKDDSTSAQKEVSEIKKLTPNTFDHKRKPNIEDNENFNGRRPIVDPFRIGEEVVMAISYFAVEAGQFTMQIRPLVQVNGKKSYHFRYLIKTSSLFNMFYKVDDVAETFVDYETLLPYSYEIHVDESKQVRETRTFFDHKKLKATMWDQKQKKNEPIEKKKIDWDLNEFSQNVFSAPYYLRNFTLVVGKKFKVHVGHEGKNILMTAEVLRKEKIVTPIGSFDTFVVKPQFDVDGKFKPTGENLLWLTDDDRKFIVRLESKVKIGAIRGEVQKIIKSQ